MYPNKHTPNRDQYLGAIQLLGQSTKNDTSSNSNGELAEYSTLRTEILGYQRDSLQILVFSGVVGGLLLGFGEHSNARFSYLFLFVFLFAAVLLQTQRLTSTYRIACYIRLFLEPARSALSYETVWRELSLLRRGNPKGVTEYVYAYLKKEHVSFKHAVTLPLVLIQIFCIVEIVYLFGVCWGICLVIPCLFALYIEGKYIYYADKIDDIERAFEKICSSHQTDTT
ncbi:MAG: hypothetical protein AAF911_12650 [Planctomycetota bacterium]